MTDRIRHGTVFVWIAPKGFGFVAADGNPEKIFLHVTRCPNGEPLAVGTRVRFAVEDTPRGPRATWIEPAAE